MKYFHSSFRTFDIELHNCSAGPFPGIPYFLFNPTISPPNLYWILLLFENVSSADAHLWVLGGEDSAPREGLLLLVKC